MCCTVQIKWHKDNQVKDVVFHRLQYIFFSHVFLPNSSFHLLYLWGGGGGTKKQKSNPKKPLIFPVDSIGQTHFKWNTGRYKWNKHTVIKHGTLDIFTKLRRYLCFESSSNLWKFSGLNRMCGSVKLLLCDHILDRKIVLLLNPEIWAWIYSERKH